MTTQRTLPARRRGRDTRFTLAQSNSMLPLVRAVTSEVIERRNRRRTLLRQRDDLERAHTPEGLAQALSDLDAAIYDQEDAILAACRELEAYGLDVLRLNPLVIHFPGRTREGALVFCWQEGDSEVAHGHPPGEEQEPRQPLRVRA